MATSLLSKKTAGCYSQHHWLVKQSMDLAILCDKYMVLKTVQINLLAIYSVVFSEPLASFPPPIVPSNRNNNQLLANFNI